MSKAEERGKIYALHKASEKLHDCYGNAMLSVVQFDGYDIKNAYIDGCHQAEKDLELTWKDMLLLADIEQDVFNHSDSPLKGVQAAYEEVLKRFKDLKK